MRYTYNLTHLPFGYRPGTGANASVPVPDETLARHIRTVFDTAAENRRALYDVSLELAEAGFTNRSGKPYSVRFLINLLKNPFYAGYVRRDGGLVRGAHKAIIDKPTFHHVHQLYWPEPGLVSAAIGCVVRVLWRLTRPRNLA